MKKLNFPIIELSSLSKSFLVGSQYVKVLKDITFNINSGDFAIIFGPSGCGKSTLLHTILGLEPPTLGNLIFMDKKLYQGSLEDDRSDLRKHYVGMVYQQPNWIKALNVAENVAFPLALLSVDESTRLKQSKEMLSSLEMLDWAEYHPSELSSGQQQRVALARALITNPQLIVADEPTGNLDYESGQKLMSLLSRLNKTEHETIVMVTHDLEYLKFGTKIIQMLDGRVVDIFAPTSQKLNAIYQSKRGKNHEKN